MDLFDLPIWLSAAVVVLLAVLLGLGVFAVTRRLLGRRADADTESLASSLVVRMATLHGLILALVFAREQVNFVQLRAATTQEASAAADLFFDLVRYDAEATLAARRAVARYAELVKGEEWALLARGELSGEAWEQWETAYQAVLDLTPTSPREEALRDGMLADVDEISDHRNERQDDAYSGVIPMFWIVAIVGVVCVLLPFFVFRGRFVNLFLLCIFSGYNGVVLYMIAAMSNPYLAPGKVEPTSFERVHRQMVEALESER